LSNSDLSSVDWLKLDGIDIRESSSWGKPGVWAREVVSDITLLKGKENAVVTVMLRGFPKACRVERHCTVLLVLIYYQDRYM
jgi:hypothetical protein